MTIGVFGDDADLDAEVAMGENPVMAYYFLDDFKMTPVDNPGEPSPALLGEKGPEPVELESRRSRSSCPTPFRPMGMGSTIGSSPKWAQSFPPSFDIFPLGTNSSSPSTRASPCGMASVMNGVLLKAGIYIWRMEWPRSVPREQRTQQGAGDHAALSPVPSEHL